MTAPRVSVRIPAYNHEKYVAACLQSVLDQTFQDFEIVITDDGSTDRTADIIRTFDDPRIRLNTFAENRGCNAAIADCGARLRGEYTACLCSDDAWMPDKLDRQVRFLDAHPDINAVFTRVVLIDDDGRPLPEPESSPFNLFEGPNRDRDQWLRFFFLAGNCLCIPSVMIRTDVYRRLRFQDRRMASVGDFDMWVRFALEHDLHIMDERLTAFRVRANQANASSDRLENHVRSHFEYKHILNHFLAIRDPARILRIFPECAEYGRPTAETIPYFLARRALDTPDRFRRLWGLETLFALLGDEAMATQLERQFGFRYKDFHLLASEHDVFALGIERELVLERHSGQAELMAAHAAADDLSAAILAGQAVECQLKTQINDLQAELAATRNTVSWRVTRPLRAVRSLMRAADPGRKPPGHADEAEKGANHG